MEFLLVFVFCGVLLMLLVASLAEESGSGILGLTCFFTGVMISVIALRGSPAQLDIHTNYFLEEVYFANDPRVQILDLKEDDWNSRYLFQVKCAKLRDGCPTKWPDQFTVVRNNDKLVIVPLIDNKTEK